MNTVLDVHDLTKHFGPTTGGFTAVDHISFDLGEGEIVGLLGPNGAGKTTTIQMLLSLLTPTSGTISYFGKSLRTHREEILQRVNTTSGYARLPWRLLVGQNLRVYAELYQVARPKQKIAELAELFEFTDLLSKRFLELSAGQKTRVLLAKAFLNDPELVLLDEPTASLDPDIAEKIRAFILSQREKRNLSVLITSHNMAEVEEVCDRVIFLSHGKIIATDTPQGLARTNKNSEVNLMVKDGLKRLVEFLEKHHYPYREKNRFITVTIPETAVATFLLEVGKHGVEYSEIEIVRPSLEDFFLNVSKG